MPRSLWLYPQRKPVIVELSRFDWYCPALRVDPLGACFNDFLWDYFAGDVPRTATVRWGPYKDFTSERSFLVKRFGTTRDVFIERVADLIADGRDVPPLVRGSYSSGGGFGFGPVDGFHRAYAAQDLGLRVAPIIDWR